MTTRSDHAPSTAALIEIVRAGLLKLGRDRHYDVVGACMQDSGWSARVLRLSDRVLQDLFVPGSPHGQSFRTLADRFSDVMRAHRWPGV